MKFVVCARQTCVLRMSRTPRRTFSQKTVNRRAIHPLISNTHCCHVGRTGILIYPAIKRGIVFASYHLLQDRIHKTNIFLSKKICNCFPRYKLKGMRHSTCKKTHRPHVHPNCNWDKPGCSPALWPHWPSPRKQSPSARQ